MNPIEFSAEKAAIRFAIDGSWTIDEFARFLQETSTVYHRINSLFILRLAIDAEEMHNATVREKGNYDQQELSWHSTLFGTSLHHPMGSFGVPPPSYENILELTQSVSQPLLVDAISYASPGWIQLVGDWNPLRVLSEFITKWRAENTKREANRMKFDNERLRIQSELAAKLLESAPKMERHHEGGTARLIDMAESVIKPATVYISQVGSNSRIIEAELVPPGCHLPDRSYPPRPPHPGEA